MCGLASKILLRWWFKMGYGHTLALYFPYLYETAPVVL